MKVPGRWLLLLLVATLPCCAKSTGDIPKAFQAAGYEARLKRVRDIFETYDVYPKDDSAKSSYDRYFSREVEVVAVPRLLPFFIVEIKESDTPQNIAANFRRAANYKGEWFAHHLRGKKYILLHGDEARKNETVKARDELLRILRKDGFLGS